MDVRNCKNCGKLFNYMGGQPICEACKDKLEDDFQKVKEFIRENPGASLQVISEENEVSVQQIQRWVREERLELTEDSPIQLSCELCGTNIRTGRYCEACKKKVATDLTNAFKKPVFEEDDSNKGKSTKDNKMRFI